jgi:hypothetical protein
LTVSRTPSREKRSSAQKSSTSKPALDDVRPHALKSRAVGLRAGVFVHVFGDNFPALSGAESSQLAALVSHVLPLALRRGVIVPFVRAGADAEVQGGFDRCPSRVAILEIAA